MPITFASNGDEKIIKKITGKDDTRLFLSSLGLIEGQAVTVVSSSRGNMILNIKGTRVAIDKIMANRIMI